jgi:hypothetical protein
MSLYGLAVKRNKKGRHEEALEALLKASEILKSVPDDSLARTFSLCTCRCLSSSAYWAQSWDAPASSWTPWPGAFECGQRRLPRTRSFGP